MDIKAKIEEIIGKVKNDPNFMKQFQSDPVKAVESVAGVDLPDDAVNKIVEGVRAKVTLDKAGSALDAVKKLF